MTSPNGRPSIVAGSTPGQDAEWHSDEVEIALLDRSGVIIAVNAGWERFARANGGDVRRTGVGVSYLDVCAAAGADPVARLAALAVRTALEGGLPGPLRILIPCHSRTSERWYDLLVSSRFAAGGDCTGATVALTRSRAPAREADRLRPFLGIGPHRPRDLDGGLLEALPDGLALVDGAGEIVYVNRQLEEMTEYDRRALVGLAVELLVPPGERERHVGRRQDFQSSAGVRPMGRERDLAIRCRDGSLLPVEISLSPAWLAGRRLTVASVRDVSARRAADHERRRLVQILDLLPDAVLVTEGESMRLAYVNRAAADLLGDSPRTLVGRACADVLPGLAGRQAADVRSVIESQGGDRAVGECQLRRGDGRLVPIESQIQIADDGGGAVFVVVIRDVSERLANEQRLRMSEESFRAAFEQAPIGMAVVEIDERGHRSIVRANTALGELLSESVDALVGADFADFTYPEDEPMDAAGARALASGQRRVYGRHKRYRRRDGSSVWVELRSSPVPFPDVAGVTALAHLVDVTERHELDRQRGLQAMTAEVVAEITTQVLSGRPLPEIYRAVAGGISRVLDVDTVTLVLPTNGKTQARVVAAVGPAAPLLLSGIASVSPEFLAAVARQDRVAVPEPPPFLDPRLAEFVGPGAAAWFGADPAEGIVAIARPPGAAPFTAVEVDRLATLTRQLALAIALGRARVDQERLSVLEDRQRIARDLHDTVIQDLIALGMQLYRGAETEPDPRRQAQQNELVGLAETAVRRLRGAVFQLRDNPQGRSVSATVRMITAEASRVLGHEPSLAVDGAVDELSAVIADHLGAVLREALSNVARHADAAATAVTLRAVDHQVRLTVEDDGRGLPQRWSAGNGIANIHQRAEALNGTATLRGRPGGGTRLSWSCPVD